MTRLYRPATYRKRLAAAKEAEAKLKGKRKSLAASAKKIANMKTLLERRAKLKGARLAAFNDKHHKYLGATSLAEVETLHRKLGIRGRSYERAAATLEQRIARLTKQLAASIKRYGA